MPSWDALVGTLTNRILALKDANLAVSMDFPPPTPRIIEDFKSIAIFDTSSAILLVAASISFQT